MATENTAVNNPGNDFPLVSIVVTAYNQAGFLSEAIESILSQDYPRVELIVLDDGSTDGTREVLNAYKDRFYWETHANMGQAATLNKGWAMSRGEILSYLSSDDYLLPGVISAAVRFLLERQGLVQVYCDFILVDGNSQTVGTKIAPEYDFSMMVADNICMPGPGVFFRRWAYEATGGWDPSFRQMPDYDFWIRLGLCGQFLKIPAVLAAYRVHDESQSIAMADMAKADEPFRSIGKLFQMEIPEWLKKIEKRAFANAFIVSARLHIRSGRFRMGLSRIGHALAARPAVACSPRSLRIIANAFRCGIARKWSQ